MAKPITKRIAARGSQPGRQAQKPPRMPAAGLKANPPRGGAPKPHKKTADPNGQARHK
jgi:hypothetical protein